jgi:hypothetical protein
MNFLWILEVQAGFKLPWNLETDLKRIPAHSAGFSLSGPALQSKQPGLCGEQSLGKKATEAWLAQMVADAIWCVGAHVHRWYGAAGSEPSVATAGAHLHDTTHRSLTHMPDLADTVVTL